jgi:hypothetical protein
MEDIPFLLQFDLERILAARIELERILPMDEVVRLSNLSEETWEREHGDKIIQLSKRRRGVRVKHALFLAD